MKLSDTMIQHPNKQKGDFNKAEELLRNSTLTTFQIHQKTGVSEPRIDLLRMKERAIDNLMADIKNHFIGHYWSEQYYSEERQDKNYAYRVNEIELRQIER